MGESAPEQVNTPDTKMSSGVAVADECKTHFEDIKKAKKHRYVVFYIKEEKSITVESVGGREASYDDFLNDLQRGGDSECSAKIKKKMLYSSSFDALKKSLVGVHKYIQATDASEASEEAVEKQLRSTDRV